MLNDILDLCIEKSDESCLYSFKWCGVNRGLSISKWVRDAECSGCWHALWIDAFSEDALNRALELMENE